MKNGRVINILEFLWVGGWWWIPLHYLVTSEKDFRCSEAVTTVCNASPHPCYKTNLFGKTHSWDWSRWKTESLTGPLQLELKKFHGGIQRKMDSKIFKSSKNDLSSELFFSDFFNGTPLIFFQNLKALETSFSKLVLHAQKVHILRELCSIKVCL